MSCRPRAIILLIVVATDMIAVPILASSSCAAVSPDTNFMEAPWDELGKMVNLEVVKPVVIESSGPTRNDPLWLTDQHGAMVYSGTMGSANVPGWAAANSTPAKFVALKTAADASEALKFAAVHNLQISVKNTGHDFFGRSARRGSLMLWTHKMTDMEWQDGFIPSGCTKEVGSTVTLGAGVQFWQVYEEAAKRKRLVMGGTCSTVGHMGWTLGGGYGDYSRMYGSGATNLVEAEVVLADGQIVIANTCGPHSDLFRALRGGGGAFGLVTKATYRTFDYPDGRIGSAHGKLYGLQASLGKFLSWYGSMVRQGASHHFGGQVVVGGWAGDALVVQLNYVGITEFECAELLFELNEVHCVAKSKIWPPDGVEWNPAGVKGWQPKWEDHDASAYHLGTMNRYLKLENLEDATFVPALAKLAQTSPKGLVVALNYALGHGSDTAVAFANQTTVHPQVYQAVATVKVDILDHNLVPTPNTKINGQAAAEFAALRSGLQALMPGSGSYYNEGDYIDEAFQESYWGSNYPDLLATKRKYDPQNAFTCHQCVGSEASPCGRRLQNIVEKHSGIVLV